MIYLFFFTHNQGNTTYYIRTTSVLITSYASSFYRTARTNNARVTPLCMNDYKTGFGGILFSNESRFSWVTTCGHVSLSFYWFFSFRKSRMNDGLKSKIMNVHKRLSDYYYITQWWIYCIQCQKVRLHYGCKGERTWISYIKINQRTTVNGRLNANERPFVSFVRIRSHSQSLYKRTL